MANTLPVGGHAPGLGATERNDKWWFEALWTGLGFLIFVVYSNWAAFQGEHYYVGTEHGGYLSPFYSPILYTDPSAPGSAPESIAWIGLFPEGLKGIFEMLHMPASPAWLILIFPLAFRLTCYYYRKFYYRAYFWTPPACAVGPMPQKNYNGERGLFIFQNLHRYAMYFAVAFIFILSYDAYDSFFRNGEFGVGVGSIVLLINPILLGTYTFGCHSFRHLVGGKKDCFSCDQSGHLSYGIWKKVSWLNSKHMLFAWISMVWVGLADVYVRLVSMGVIHDYNTWGN